MFFINSFGQRHVSFVPAPAAGLSTADKQDGRSAGTKKGSGLEKLLFQQLNFNRLADGCIMYIKMLRYFLQGIAIRYMGL